MEMKISKKKLEELIREAVSNKLNSIALNESRDFTAKRQIIQSAQNSSMAFESEIVKLLNLVPPDELPPEIQQTYHAIVEDMKEKFVQNVVDATEKLSRFPRNDRGGE